MKKTVLLFALIITSQFCSAQTKTFTWFDYLCLHSGEYDEQKFSTKTIEDTHEYVTWMPKKYPNFFKIKGPSRYQLFKAKKEIRAHIRKIRKYKLPTDSIWEQERELSILSLRSAILKMETNVKAYRDPTILKRNYPDSTCNSFENILIIGGDSLISFWEAFILKESKKTSDSTNYYKVNFLDKFNSPNKYQYAFHAILTFGWSNCMAFNTKPLSKVNLRRLFEKLFTNYKVACSI